MGSGTGNSIDTTDVIRGCRGFAILMISLRPDTRNHATVRAAVKDKPSAALKKRRP
jgi:hypothetical protein